MDKLIEKLLNSFAVCSREDSIREAIKDEIIKISKARSIDVNIEEDLIGNLIVKLGKGKEKYMLCTHMDNPGVIALQIEDSGFLRVYPVGSCKAEKLAKSLIRFKNGTLGRLDSSKSNPSKDELFVDIGVSSREVALNKVQEGDVAELVGNILESHGRLMGSNLHNKLACYILIEVIRSMELENLNKEVYFVFSAQREAGFKGARAAAFKIKPQVAIVLDTLEVEDYIGGKAEMSLDKGPIISIFDKSLLIHKEVKGIIEKVAKEEKINLQYSIGSDKNEGGLIHKEVGGIKTATIGFPCRYMHTSEEMVSLNDVNDTTKLIKSIIGNAEKSLED